MAKLKKCPDCGATVSTSAKACPQCGSEKIRPWRAKHPILFLIGMAFLLSSVISAFKEVRNEHDTVARDLDPESAIRKIKFDYRWHTIGDGLLMKLDATITNNGSYSVKDIEIHCNDIAKSGTKIDSNTRTLYEIIKSGQTKRLNGFDMGFIHSQAASAACNISRLTVIP